MLPKKGGHHKNYIHCASIPRNGQFMRYVTGQIYHGGEFTEGYFGFEDGIIKETGEGLKKDTLAKGIIIPTFTNAHTHIGDAVIMDEVQGGIREIVAPPDGLKHRILRDTSQEGMRNSMRQVAKNMLYSGIEHFNDFREGGLKGVKILKDAFSDSPISPKVFGRPSDLRYYKDEMEQLLKIVDGIGVSAISDWEEDEIKSVASHTKREGKMFVLHASEAVREDIDSILDLKPDYLIHMNKATDDDLKICAENEVPIILCPRSEVFFGHVPDIPKMLKSNVTLALGTDNAMLNSPSSILREMEFAYKISRLKGGCKAKDILDMVLINPRKVLNASFDICLTQGKDANFIVFQLPYKNPAYALVNGACAQNISIICINDFLWSKK